MFMHCAAIISVAALALRDQLKLRAVLLVSIALNAIYNALTTPPNYQSIFWNGVMSVINLIVLVQIILDRTHIGMSVEENELFSAFRMLTPGGISLHRQACPVEYGQRGRDHDPRGRKASQSLLRPDRHGNYRKKSGRSFCVGPKTFIGEIAFLNGSVASATATLDGGARYVSWPIADLDKRIQGRQALKHAVVRLISFDMAMKVARS